MVDLLPRTATRIGKKLERFDPFWFEEPVPPEDLDGLVRVGRRGGYSDREWGAIIHSAGLLESC